MNYHEKKTVVISVMGLLISTSYLFFAIFKYNEGTVESLTLKFWAARMLLFIGIGVVAIIITLILFHIFYAIFLAIKLKSENKEMSDKDCQEKINQMMKTDIVEDEMAKLIELKSMRFGFIIAGIGFVLALVLLLLDYSPVIMINTLFLSFSFGSVLEGVVQLYYYKRGINHA